MKPILEEDLVRAMDRLNGDGRILDVLVIDDDPNNLRLIEKILLDKGHYRPILAQGGKAGWEMINSRNPQAIILDLFMPDVDGFSILERLRVHPTFSQIPVLVVSGGTLDGKQREQLNSLGQHFIAKNSLTEEELISSIEETLNKIPS